MLKYQNMSKSRRKETQNCLPPPLLEGELNGLVDPCVVLCCVRMCVYVFEKDWAAHFQHMQYLHSTPRLARAANSEVDFGISSVLANITNPCWMLTRQISKAAFNPLGF